MSPARETQSMREIRLLRGRLPRKGGGLTGMNCMFNDLRRGLTINFVDIGDLRWISGHEPMSIKLTPLPTMFHIMMHRVHLVWAGFELTTIVVINTDCIGSYKSNYHAITTTTASYVSSIRLVVNSHRTTLTTWPPATTCCLVYYIFIRGLDVWKIKIILMEVIFICGGNPYFITDET
jgi:hypothetical protein